MSWGYHWFVAWRYLMARPRKWSRPLAIASAVAALGAILLSTLAVGFKVQPGALLGVAGGCALVSILTATMFAIRHYVSFFTMVSMSGVMIGTMALVIVLSVMSGFETDLQQKILGFNAHILVTKEDGEFTEYRDVGAVIAADPDVVADTPYVTSEVVITANNSYVNVIIKGVDPKGVGRVIELERTVQIRERRGKPALTDDERESKQRAAVKGLWPLYDDAGVRDEPIDAGVPEVVDDRDAGDAGIGPDATDPAPPDLQIDDMGASPDLSGGLSGEEVEIQEADEVVDPAPDDLAVGSLDSPDLSGGLSADEVAALGDGDGDGDDDDDGANSGDRGSSDRAGPLNGGLTGDAGIADLGALGDPIAFEDFGNPGLRIPERVALLPGVLVGQEMDKTMHLFVGQEVRIVSPLGEMTPQGKRFYARFLRVSGIFYTGMYEYDLKFIYVDMETLQTFLNLGDQVNGIEVRVSDPERSAVVRDRLAKELGPGYRVRDWKELNRSLFSALKLEKIAMFLVLGIIIVVASFSIVGTLIMVVVEKAREIALLKTLGSSDTGVMKVFVAQGVCIGLVGTGLGVTLGLSASLLLQHFGFPLDPDVYYIDRLPIRVEYLSVAAIAVAGVAISAAATIYPALVASRLRPSDGMRYE